MGFLCLIVIVIIIYYNRNHVICIHLILTGLKSPRSVGVFVHRFNFKHMLVADISVNMGEVRDRTGVAKSDFIPLET